jgi:hypothetical protein
MSNVNIFQNSTKTAPESDEQIVRVSMKELEIQGRTSHLPATEKSGVLPLSHVPNSGSTMK